TRSVLIRPGASVFTVMPSAATWSARVFDHAVVALRTLFDSIRLAIGCLTEDDVLVMIRPHFFAFINGKHSRVSRMTDNRLTSTAVCQSSSLKLSNVPGLGPPALL